MTKNAASGSITRILAVGHAFPSTILTDEVLNILTKNPKLAEVAVAAIQAAASSRHVPFGEQRSPTVSLQKRTIVQLAGARVRTPDDLKYFSEDDLVVVLKMSTATIDSIKAVAAQSGVALFEAGDNPLKKAIELAGDTTSIPAHLMVAWQPSLDKYTRHFLMRTTLGELTRLSRASFLEMRQRSNQKISGHALDQRDKRQATYVQAGLVQANLNFTSE